MTTTSGAGLDVHEHPGALAAVRTQMEDIPHGMTADDAAQLLQATAESPAEVQASA